MFKTLYYTLQKGVLLILPYVVLAKFTPVDMQIFLDNYMGKSHASVAISAKKGESLTDQNELL